MTLKPGHLVQAMVLDTLSGRTPLYRVERFMAEHDIELLLGTKIAASAFNDNNLARGLDAIFETGASKILTNLGIQAVKEFSLDTRSLSYETTSTSVWGDYEKCEHDVPPPGPSITHGFSKDHRPDLKQFMTELLCVDGGVPIFGQTLDGNSSDKTSNNKILSRISSLMTRHGLGPGAFVYVADSAMVTRQNLEIVDSTRFISRLPASYKECKRAIGEAVGSKKWISLDTLAETPTGTQRPTARYKVLEASVDLFDTSYRALVVHSSSHDKRRQKKLDKAIVASSEALTNELSKIETVYFCEADAVTAAKGARCLSAKLHIALMVCRLMERTMRQNLADNNKVIEGWCRRKTNKPTSFMMTTALVGIMVAIVKNKRILLKYPEARQADFLTALGLDYKVFLDPRKKCHLKNTRHKAP